MWDGAFIHNPKGGEQHSTCVAVPQLANVDSRTRWFGQERPNELGKNNLVPGIGCGPISLRDAISRPSAPPTACHHEISCLGAVEASEQSVTDPQLVRRTIRLVRLRGWVRCVELNGHHLAVRSRHRSAYRA